MDEFLSREPAVLRILEMAEKASRSQASVLLTGESGTGKNRLASFIHSHGSRSGGPFVDVACANLPGELLESELFGHERGAFTGAHEVRPGRFEQAEGGTLYLDEIHELDRGIQAKLLRVLEEKRFERLGGNLTLSADVRIIASTRHDPDRLVEEGLLRDDLFYRLNVVRLHLPPLRERSNDLEILAAAFLRSAVERHGLPPRRLSAEALDRLRRYAWPGNLRELAHAVESAAVLAAGEEIQISELPRDLSLASPAMLRSVAASGLSLAEVESAYIDEILRRTGGNKSEAARILGIHRKTLHEKLRARAGRP
jgi:two-component system response regulator HydG